MMKNIGIKYALLGITLTTLGVGYGLKIPNFKTNPGEVPQVLGEFVTTDPNVLAASTTADDFQFSINVPARFLGGAKFDGTVDFLQDITVPNVIYSIKTGDGISSSGGQNPTLTNTGVLSLNSKTGKISIEAGDGITLDGLKITNSGIKSLSAGDGISIDGNKITNTREAVTPDYTLSGWTDAGTTVGLSTITDSVVMDTVTFGNATITSGESLIPDTDLGSDLGSSSKRFNNLWVANINSNSSQSFSGQTTFSYAPTDTTISQASILVNPTTSAANGQLLGLGIAGYQRALIDEDGDLVLGYNSATSAPATDYPLDIYGHSGTRVSFVDTTGGAYFAGNVGIGTTSPEFELSLDNDGAIIAKGTYNSGATLTTAGAGTRLIWYPKKAAFRAGAATGTQWNDANIGPYSFASGNGTKAVGYYSTALGTGTEARGSSTFAMGNGSLAIGEYSSVFGLLSQATGERSFASGYYINTGSYSSTAFGRFNVGGGSASSWVATDPLFELGMGTADAARANALTVLKNGNVGIGISAPTSKLHVSGSVAGKALAIFDDNTGTDQALLTASAAGVTKFTIDHDGNVGIKSTPSSTYPLYVTGNIYSSGTIRAGSQVQTYTIGTSGFVMADFSVLSNYDIYLGPAVNYGVGVGTNAPIGKFHVTGAMAGKALAIFDETGTDQDIFTASASGVPMFTIKHDGKVGIGTTSPTQKLEVNGVGRFGQIMVGDNFWPGGSAKGLAYQDSKVNIYTWGANFRINTGTATGSMLEIDSIGRTGIGIAAPTSKLHVTGGVTGKALAIFDDTGTDQDIFTASASGVTKFTIAHDGVITTSLGTGTVYSNSGVLTNTDPSDATLKHNVQTLNSETLDKVLGLRPVSYNWNSTGDGALGFIAQEVKEIFPGLVGSNADGKLGLYTTQFIPVLTKAIQLQQLQIDGLSTVIASPSATITQPEWETLTAIVNNIKNVLLAEINNKIREIKETILGFADKFTTKELCVGEKENETCLTKEQLDDLLIRVGTIATPSATPTIVITPSITLTPTPTLEVTPTPDSSESGEVATSSANL